MSGSEGGGDAVSLNRNHLPRVDEAEDRLRQRQHCPWREDIFKLLAVSLSLFQASTSDTFCQKANTLFHSFVAVQNSGQ